MYASDTIYPFREPATGGFFFVLTTLKEMKMTITQEYVEERIASVDYIHVPDTTMTICVLKSVNGFVITGESACVNPDEYDQVLGQKYAYEKAFHKLCELEGYLMCEDIYQAVLESAEQEHLN